MSEVVRTFLTAYNAGERGLADRFFAPAGTFQWYSEYRRRQSPDAYDRATLESYLQTRHAQGDRLALASLSLAGKGGDFAFSVRRPGTPEPAVSKAKLDCRSGHFILWALGPNPGP